MASIILVPYDFSTSADAALKWAYAYAQSTGGTLHVLNVIQLPDPALLPIPLATLAHDHEDVVQAKMEVSRALQRLNVEANIDVTMTINVADSILVRAGELGAALIVMGTHGRGGFKRAVMGSVSDFVVRHANCPVVTIREPAASKVLVGAAATV